MYACAYCICVSTVYNTLTMNNESKKFVNTNRHHISPSLFLTLSKINLPLSLN